MLAKHYQYIVCLLFYFLHKITRHKSNTHGHGNCHLRFRNSVHGAGNEGRLQRNLLCQCRRQILWKGNKVCNFTIKFKYLSFCSRIHMTGEIQGPDVAVPSRSKCRSIKITSEKINNNLIIISVKSTKCVVILILLISATNHESLGFFWYLSKISKITFVDQHALYCLKPDCALGALIISSPSYMCTLCSISGKTKSKIHCHVKKRNEYGIQWQFASASVWTGVPGRIYLLTLQQSACKVFLIWFLFQFLNQQLRMLIFYGVSNTVDPRYFLL